MVPVLHMHSCTICYSMLSYYNVGFGKARYHFFAFGFALDAAVTPFGFLSLRSLSLLMSSSSTCLSSSSSSATSSS